MNTIRQRIVYLTLLASLTTVCFAQQTMKHVWQKVHISSDSLRPYRIGFVDSLTGYFSAFTYTTNRSVGPSSNVSFPMTHLHYKTTNGGKNWDIIQDSLFTSNPYYSRAYLPANSYYFPTQKDLYIILSVDDTSIIVPIVDTILHVPGMWIIRSHDGGKSWIYTREQQWAISTNTPSIRSTHRLVGALGGKDLLFYCDTGIYRNRLLRSYDGGLTIPYISSDELFARTLRPDTAGDYQDRTANFYFDISDPLHWTAIVIGARGSADSAVEYKLFPRGLRTLVTSNGGKSWEVFNTQIPWEEDLPLHGAMQYIKETPHLYYFSSYGQEGFFNTEWDLSTDPPTLKTYMNTARPMLGINFCYSSDYGKTWKIDTTFGWRRRAYEAVTKDELWFTLPKKETGRDDDPAYILTRTTDGGATYAFDTTTLTHFEQKLDGRIITFSDPRHGWIVATGNNHKDLYILRYDANEQPKGVEEEIYKGYYGLHYTLYPNPASETATLDLYKYFVMEDMKAYNILGAEVPLRYHIEGSKVELDVRTLPIGHYTLRIKHNWGLSIIPLVVMR